MGYKASRYKPFIDPATMHFSTNVNSRSSHKIPDFKAPFQYSKWDDILHGETFIAYEVFENLSYMYKVDGRCL